MIDWSSTLGLGLVDGYVTWKIVLMPHMSLCADFKHVWPLSTIQTCPYNVCGAATPMAGHANQSWVNQFKCETWLWRSKSIDRSCQRQVKGCQLQQASRCRCNLGFTSMMESSHEHTAVLSLCHWTAGAVGWGASREESGWPAVLCGPGLWKRPPGSHTDQWRGKLGAGWMLAFLLQRWLVSEHGYH